MKLEKREITLNEYDSLKDVFYMEKTLLLEYAQAVGKATRKQTLHVLLDFMKETCEDLYFIQGLMNGSAIENE